MQAPRTGWAETDPALWWAALGQVVEGMADDLQAHQSTASAWPARCTASCSATVPGHRCGRRSSGRTAGPQQHLSRWHELSAADRARLSNPIVPGMFGPILSWLADNEASVVARAAVALLPKDVVRVGLTASPAPTGATRRRPCCGT